MNREPKAALALPDGKTFCDEVGVEFAELTQAEFDACFREERDRRARTINEIGASID